MFQRDDPLGAYLLVGGLNVVSLVDRLPVQHRSAFSLRTLFAKLTLPGCCRGNDA